MTGLAADSLLTVVMALPVGGYGAQSAIALVVFHHMPREFCLGDGSAGHIHAPSCPRASARRLYIYAGTGVVLMLGWWLTALARIVLVFVR